MKLPETNKLQAISDYIRKHIGLHFPPDRFGELNRKLTELATESGYPDRDRYFDSVLKNTGRKHVMETLASKLTVGESYFWRDGGLYNLLQQELLPEIIRKKENGVRHLRVWSAGCSTGEEPYSIAIAIKRALPAYRDWNISVLATDIHPGSLERAAGAVYGEWSFRNAPSWLKENYFQRAGRNQYLLDESIRKMVSFRYLNLFDDPYPSLTNQTNGMDLIFCRNVLMYFSEEDMRLVSDRFYDCLVDEGLLITTAVESFQYVSGRFHPAHYRGQLLYRKSHLDTEKKNQEEPPSQSGKQPAGKRQAPGLNKAVRPEGKKRFHRPDRQGRPGTVKTGRVEHSLEKLITLCRELAGQGRLEEAGDVCNRALGKSKTAPEAYYMKALIESELGNQEEAYRLLGKLLYLDPDHILAHYTMGMLAFQQKRAAKARKHLENAAGILDRTEPEEIIRDSEGMSAGRLSEIIQNYLDTVN